MRGGESKLGSVFSWADEAEKEEQEAAPSAGRSCQAQPQQWQKKPNPFGSARPREFVLQDRGIDWRQLDLHLQQSSPLPHEFHQNEEMQKQSNHQPAATPVVNSKPPVRSPQVISTPRIPSPTSLLPPLRYPPKYVAGFLYEHWTSSASNASGYRHFKPEKENRSPGGGKFNILKSESAMCEIGNTGRRRRTELVEAKEAQQRAKNSERKGNFHGLPLVNQKLGTPAMHGKRMSLSANGIGRQPRNVRDDSGMDENKSIEHKWQKATENWHRLSVSQVNGGVTQKLMGDRTGLGKNKVKNFEKEGIKLHN